LIARAFHGTLVRIFTTEKIKFKTHFKFELQNKNLTNAIRPIGLTALFTETERSVSSRLASVLTSGALTLANVLCTFKKIQRIF
jgi:hypothetical protein